MKKLLQITTLIFLAVTAHSQDLQGRWNGTLSVQGSTYRIVFDVSKTDKRYKATLDSPDQNTSGILVTSININDRKVKFEISGIGTVYEGTLSNDLITGKWMQAGQTFPLVLSKTQTLPYQKK